MMGAELQRLKIQINDSPGSLLVEYKKTAVIGVRTGEEKGSEEIAGHRAHAPYLIQGTA